MVVDSCSMRKKRRLRVCFCQELQSLGILFLLSSANGVWGGKVFKDLQYG